jgi:hypothetical protein
LNAGTTPGSWIQVNSAKVAPSASGTGGTITVGFGLNSDSAAIVNALIDKTQFATADLEQVSGTTGNVTKASQFSTVSIAELDTSATSGAIKESAVLDFATGKTLPLPSTAPVADAAITPSGRLAVGFALPTAINIGTSTSGRKALFRINSFTFAALPGGAVGDFTIGKNLDNASLLLLAAMEQGDGGTLTIEAEANHVLRMTQATFFDLKFTDVTLGRMGWSSLTHGTNIKEALTPQVGGSAFSLTQTTGATGDLGLTSGLNPGPSGQTIAPRTAADGYALRVTPTSGPPVTHPLDGFTIDAAVSPQNALTVTLEIRDSFAAGTSGQQFTAGTAYSDAQLLLRNAQKKVIGLFDLGATKVTSASDSTSGTTTHETADFSASALSLQLLGGSSPVTLSAL